MNQKQIERKSLIVSSIVNLIITGAGVWVFMATQIQALFVDCFFSLIGLVSTILAVVISNASKKKTKLYPDGIYFLEPLYAILKSLLILILLGVSVVSTAQAAYQYFVNGIGEPMNIGPVLPYTIAMVILCVGLSLFNRFQNKKINNISTMLKAEANANLIDGLQSLGIGVAIILLSFISLDGPLGFLHYTGDFFVTALLALISLKQPIHTLISSFKELSGATTDDKEAKRRIGAIVDTHFGPVADKIKCDIFKIGMHFKIRISMPQQADADVLHSFEQARQGAVEDLKKNYDSVEVALTI